MKRPKESLPATRDWDGIAAMDLVDQVDKADGKN
jgi:hypothetical protein